MVRNRRIDRRTNVAHDENSRPAHTWLITNRHSGVEIRQHATQRLTVTALTSRMENSSSRTHCTSRSPDSPRWSASTAAASARVQLRSRLRISGQASMNSCMAWSGPAWSFPPHPAIDQVTVEALGRKLGVTPGVRQITPTEGGGWMAGAADYSGTTLTVSADALGSWWFSDAVASLNGQVPCGGFTATNIEPIPAGPATGVVTGVVTSGSAAAPAGRSGCIRERSHPCNQAGTGQTLSRRGPTPRQ